MDLVEIANINSQNVESWCDSRECLIVIFILAIIIGWFCVEKGVLYFLLNRKNKTEDHWLKMPLSIIELLEGVVLLVLVGVKAFNFTMPSRMFLVFSFFFSFSIFSVYLEYEYKHLIINMESGDGGKVGSPEESVNHTLQELIMASFILLFIVLWVIVLNSPTKELIPMGIFTLFFPLIFKDSIAGAIAYFHIHATGLLRIGDWIQVPSYHIDGMVKDINLVSVIIENWDNTLSNVPICALQNGGFKNYQQMLDGNTSGRRMFRSFIIDTNSVVEFGKNEVDNLIKIVEAKDNLSEQNEQYNSSIRIKNVFKGTPVLNLRLFREYLTLWLASNSNVSLNPRLVVRVMEQTIEGIPLQVYVFITKNSLVEFEKEQSKITEHIITSMEWFGLKLYQRPASADLKNDNLKN